MTHRPRIAVAVACLFLWPLAAVPAADPPAARKIFAAEAWYQAAEGKEQAFEGILEKAKSPGATSGRWNPVRLVGAETPTREVYLGNNTNLLDGHLGRRVRIVGKPMEVLGHAEIWPASIEPVAATASPVAIAPTTSPPVTDALGAATTTGMRVLRETISREDHCQTVAWRSGELILGTIQNMVIGAGHGDQFTLWRRRDGEPEWRTERHFPDHSPSMADVLPLDDGSTLVLYTDRRNEPRRRVFLHHVGEGGVRQLFDFATDSQGVLNPQLTRLDDRRVLVLIPDRNAGVDTRRFLVDLDAGTHERLPDIPMPARGGRLYETLRDGNRLIVPHSMIHRLDILAIDLPTGDHSLHEVDAFTSVSGEPPRGTCIFKLQDSGQYALVYLRPAAFSDRVGKQGPPTGLLGEIVLNVVDARTLASVRRTVIAGFRAEAAATHNMAAVQTGPREFVLAHAEVDRIHQRHLTGEHKNYVGGFITRWRIGPDGSPELLERCELPPFYGTRMVADDAGGARLVCRQSGEGDPLQLFTILTR